ncbi:MAG: Rieske (2Fe-2S) protein [Deltaproteobacteria bacterium]|nr:Rieske (2Fe-2S) protein [Deltaproteobacteria bacterium]
MGAGASLSLSFFKKGSVHGAAAPSEAKVPLARLRSPWSFAEIEFTKKIKTHRGLQPSTFPGYVIRVPDAIANRLALKDGLYAISRICPHEGCPINFYRRRADAPFPLTVEEFANPMLVCTCHQSAFDPAQGGKVLSGPAPRPPWTFDFVIRGGNVVIRDLEPGGEKWG